MRFNHVRASVLAAMLLAGSPGLALAQNAGSTGTTGTATTPAVTTPAVTTPAVTTPANGNVATGETGGGWGGGWWGLIGLIGLFGLAGGRSRVSSVPPATGIGTGTTNSRL